MFGVPFLIVSLVLALFVFGAPPLLPRLERLHRRMQADLERKFREGAAATEAEALVVEQKESIRRIADEELVKYSRARTSHPAATATRAG